MGVSQQSPQGTTCHLKCIPLSPVPRAYCSWPARSSPRLRTVPRAAACAQGQRPRPVAPPKLSDRATGSDRVRYVQALSWPQVAYLSRVAGALHPAAGRSAVRLRTRRPSGPWLWRRLGLGRVRPWPVSAAPGHRNAAAPRPAQPLTCTQDPAPPAQQEPG